MLPQTDWASSEGSLFHRVSALLDDARAGRRPVVLAELEELYTTGCAEALELEAESLRLRRRAGAESEQPSEAPSLAAAAVADRLADLRAELRHVAVSIEFLREQSEAADAS